MNREQRIKEIKSQIELKNLQIKGLQAELKRLEDQLHKEDVQTVLDSLGTDLHIGDELALTDSFKSFQGKNGTHWEVWGDSSFYLDDVYISDDEYFAIIADTPPEEDTGWVTTLPMKIVVEMRKAYLESKESA